MSNPFIRNAVRMRFALTSRDKATARIRDALARYLKLADELDARRGAVPVTVPPMLGVDEDMRGWSFFMLLEHNTIVNRAISTIVQGLARGEDPANLKTIDPKRDVMPSPNPGEEQVAAFRTSVEAHRAAVADLGPLRGTRTIRHPIFGPFDAHRWHCMLGFHLDLHTKQARHIVRGAGAG